MTVRRIKNFKNTHLCCRCSGKLYTSKVQIIFSKHTFKNRFSEWYADRLSQKEFRRPKCDNLSAYTNSVHHNLWQYVRISVIICQYIVIFCPYINKFCLLKEIKLEKFYGIQMRTRTDCHKLYRDFLSA